MKPDQHQLLAAALYEIRVLLSGAGGSSPEAEASALAYAMHNDSLAVISGQTFDVEESLMRLRRMDQRLGTTVTTRMLLHFATSSH